MLKDKQQAMACAGLRRRHPRPASLALPAVPNPFQVKPNRPTVPQPSSSTQPINQHFTKWWLTIVNM